MNDLNNINMPYNYDEKPINVNIYHPIIIIAKPMKKKILPTNFDLLVKNNIVFLRPIKAIIPIKNEIY